MAHLTEIVAHLDELLEIGAFDDYGPNGLQVPGRLSVERVVSGVSGGLELFEAARDRGAQLVLVHHGILWDFHPRRLNRVMAGRLRVLLENDISLAMYHLPLDAHPQRGNNALIAQALGCAATRPFGMARGRPIGVAGELPGDGREATELFAAVAALTGREPLVFDYGPQRVRNIGIISGAAAGSVSQAIGEGLDCFVTGEPAEHVMNDAREGAIHFVAAGHYATETFGIRALGEHVAERFGVSHEFLDLPNPV